MSYLKFERATMTNLQTVMQKELLRTNRSGAYSCSTLVDCNTRKYHGLLVIPVPGLDDDNHVLLSSLDCSVVQHGVQFNLGLHKYQGNSYSPNGHKYIREFNCDIVLVYDDITCKGAMGLAGVVNDQAKDKNKHLVWVQNDMFDHRTISRNEMRRQFSEYMTAVMQEEPLDASLVDFDDYEGW